MLDVGNREYVARMAKINNTHNFFCRKSEEMRSIENVGVNGKKQWEKP